MEVELKKQHRERFNPYDFNAGTSLAIKLKDCIVLASDTRHSSQSVINSRKASKIYTLNNFHLITTGFYADGYEVYIKLMYSMMDYEITNGKKMKIQNLAHVLHNLLYSKRFFPYYAYCILCGFDEDPEIEEGKAVPYLYSYDCVGSYQDTQCRVDGSGTCMIQPLLDSRIAFKNWEECKETIDVEEVKKIVRVAFVSASERDVQTGDFMEMLVLKKESSERFEFNLRFD